MKIKQPHIYIIITILLIINYIYGDCFFLFDCWCVGLDFCIVFSHVCGFIPSALNVVVLVWNVPEDWIMVYALLGIGQAPHWGACPIP